LVMARPPVSVVLVPFRVRWEGLFGRLNLRGWLKMVDQRRLFR